jgi:organic hydroperoxide reductase OsmC/OhrA
MVKNESGRLWINKVKLSPKIEYSGKKLPSPLSVRLHQLAHKQCFVANSVKTEILVLGS